MIFRIAWSLGRGFNETRFGIHTDRGSHGAARASRCRCPSYRGGESRGLRVAAAAAVFTTMSPRKLSACIRGQAHTATTGTAAASHRRTTAAAKVSVIGKSQFVAGAAGLGTLGWRCLTLSPQVCLVFLPPLRISMEEAELVLCHFV